MDSKALVIISWFRDIPRITLHNFLCSIFNEWNQRARVGDHSTSSQASMARNGSEVGIEPVSRHFAVSAEQIRNSMSNRRDGYNGHLEQLSALVNWLDKLKDSDPHCSRSAISLSHRFCRAAHGTSKAYAGKSAVHNGFHHCTCQLLLSGCSDHSSLDPVVLVDVNGAVSGISGQ